MSDKKVSRWIILELLRPLGLVALGIEKVYGFVSGPSNIRRSKARDEQFGLEIRENLSFLFDDFGASTLNDETLAYPRPFDYAVIIVVLTAFSLRFIRGRGEFRVQVGHAGASAAWEDLPVVLNLINSRFQQREFSSFAEVATALKTHIGHLQEAFSTDRESELRRRLGEIHDQERTIMRQWETEVNRRLSH